MKKAYKIRLFGDFVFCEFDGKMAESIENKGFYRTQSKIATELIIEHRYFCFVAYLLIVKLTQFRCHLIQ